MSSRTLCKNVDDVPMNVELLIMNGLIAADGLYQPITLAAQCLLDMITMVELRFERVI